jgi:6-phosphogluconolactonase (cycloisomerase 2 family)
MGPFSVAVDTSGKFAYVANFASRDISAFSIDATASTGALTPVSGSPFMVGTDMNPISVTVDPSRKFVYTANYSLSGSVSAFSINASTGGLNSVTGSPLTAGSFPEAITISGTTH